MEFHDRRTGRVTDNGYPFPSMDAVKSANTASGQHWFSPDANRFFSSRFGNDLHTGPGGQFFVSSESPPGGQRSYSVRRVNPDASIETHGEFGEHPTHARATSAARRAAAGR